MFEIMPCISILQATCWCSLQFVLFYQLNEPTQSGLIFSVLYRTVTCQLSNQWTSPSGPQVHYESHRQESPERGQYLWLGVPDSTQCWLFIRGSWRAFSSVVFRYFGGKHGFWSGVFHVPKSILYQLLRKEACRVIVTETAKHLY